MSKWTHPNFFYFNKTCLLSQLVQECIEVRSRVKSKFSNELNESPANLQELNNGLDKEPDLGDFAVLYTQIKDKIGQDKRVQKFDARGNFDVSPAKKLAAIVLTDYYSQDFVGQIYDVDQTTVYGWCNKYKSGIESEVKAQPEGIFKLMKDHEDVITQFEAKALNNGLTKVPDFDLL